MILPALFIRNQVSLHGRCQSSAGRRLGHMVIITVQNLDIPGITTLPEIPNQELLQA